MFRFAMIASVAALLSSCGSNKTSQDQVTKYYDDGRARPIITLAPVIDTASFEAPWSISEEFGSTLSDKLKMTGTLYLNADSEKFLSSSQNPFGSDLSWIRKEFAPNEFVVFLEIVQHEIVPVEKTHYYDPTLHSSHLNVAVRLRIIDIRSSTPKVVLQELIKESQYVGRSLMPFDYNQNPWGTEEYLSSPMGLAHSSISKQLVERINDYILLAKSRWNG
jgi:hypothetical protein